MHAENFVIDLCGNRKEIKKIHELCPDECTPVLADAFSLKTVGLSHLARLVVTTQKRKPPRVSQFEKH